MPTQLTFKGDKKSSKSKKRKAPSSSLDTPEDASLVAVTTISNATGKDAPTASLAIEDDDSWVSVDAPTDLAGPVILVLPLDPPACIASDANGTVFAMEVENMVDKNPDTSEPHDVRQVWVATRIAGLGEGVVSLKGGHGRYLGVDKFGILSATKEAIGPEEQLSVLPSPDTPGMFAVQTQRDKFLSISSSSVSNKKSTGPTSTEIRGDADSIDFNSTLRLRMQARFKPRNKANKEARAREKVSRKELEEAVGRRLEDDEVRKLKRARREGNFHEMILDTRVKGKHDKFASS